jgi:cytochrome c oxidase cbb3-type subunit 3
MENRIAIIIALLFAVGLAACQTQQDAAEGATPPIGIPVGPPPGYEAFSPPVKNPYANDQLALAQGRSLFVWFNCSGCHGGHGGGGMGPSLRDETWIYGSSDAQVFNSIAEGRGKGMPAWGLKLPQDQIWQLVAYIKSMRTPTEPNPPE